MLQAIMRGVILSLFSTLRLRFFLLTSRMDWTTLACPFWQARCNPVFPENGTSIKLVELAISLKYDFNEFDKKLDP